MAFNQFNLPNSAFQTENFPLFDAGVVLVDESGTTYVARAAYSSVREFGEMFQSFATTSCEGSNGSSFTVPETARVVWYPDGGSPAEQSDV